jgi:esterase/lipase
MAAQGITMGKTVYRRGRQSAFALLAAGFAIREVGRVRNRRRMRAGLNHLTPESDLGSFVESRPRLSSGFARVPHAVLLLHGYSATAYEFEHLMQELDRQGIPYLTPTLTGHGLDDFRLLYHVSPVDWLRDSIVAYDQLAVLADKVSVIGHSTGATLAVAVAERRPVHHLILSAPNLYPSSADRRIKRAMNTPVVSALIGWLLPVFAKPVRAGRAIASDTLDEAAARTGFSYATLPIRSLRAQWALQDQADLHRAGRHSLTLIYGEQDQTVDVVALRAQLDRQGVAYTAYSFANAAHNVLLDYDRDKAIQAIVGVLKR